MNPKIPIPTDNIYKFGATFGLVFMLLMATLVFFNTKTSNETVITKYHEQLELEKNKNQPYYKEKSSLLERQIEVAVSDRKTYRNLLAILFALSFWTSVYCFKKWYTEIQPIHDRILELQKEKLEIEVQQLKRDIPESFDTD